MVAVYQATVYISIALLAIVMTVFVLAVSLLGRAVRISIEEQVKFERNGLEKSQSEIANLTEQLKKAVETNEQPNMDRIQKSINKIKWRQTFSKLKLRWISIKPKFLGVPLGVIVPGLLFLVAFFSSTFATYFEPSSHSMALSLWYTSLITILIGIINILFTLRVTQSVAITSEETSYLRQKEMMKSALIEVEEAKKPSLILQFQNEQPPFDIVSNQQKVIAFTIHLDKGDIAVHPRVMFFVHEGFKFPGHRSHKQPLTVKKVGGLLSSIIDFQRCTKAFDEIGRITIGAPSEKDSFEAWYKVGCDSYDGEFIPFKINVL